MSSHRMRTALVFALALALAAPALGYTVYLKDGSKILAREPYKIEGDQAIITLLNGTRTSISAAEIDLARTREANQSDYGSALVLEDGKLTEAPSEEAAPKQESLSDLIERRETSARTRPQVRRPPPSAQPESKPLQTMSGLVDFQTLPRRPFRDLDLASEVQSVFRSIGVKEVLVYQGTGPDRLLLDVTANSEAAVFRSLEAAAEALLRLRQSHPGERLLFELLLTTADREPAGQFELTPDTATQLAGKQIETSAFFIEHVRF